MFVFITRSIYGFVPGTSKQESILHDLIYRPVNPAPLLTGLTSKSGLQAAWPTSRVSGAWARCGVGLLPLGSDPNDAGLMRRRLLFSLGIISAGSEATIRMFRAPSTHEGIRCSYSGGAKLLPLVPIGIKYIFDRHGARKSLLTASLPAEEILEARALLLVLGTAMAKRYPFYLFRGSLELLQVPAVSLLALRWAIHNWKEAVVILPCTDIFEVLHFVALCSRWEKMASALSVPDFFSSLLSF